MELEEIKKGMQVKVRGKSVRQQGEVIAIFPPNWIQVDFGYIGEGSVGFFHSEELGKV